MWNKELVQTWPRGQLFVISAPAGAGKTTLAKYLTCAFPNVVQTPSLTTRPKRADEVAGVDYHFVSTDEFLQRESQGDLLEHIELHGYLYGTSRQDIEKDRASGRHVVLVIDTRGARALKKELHPVLIFVKPPSMDVLRERLVKRGSEDVTHLERRLEWAEGEMADAHHFDYTIVNDDLHKACDVLASIIIAESHKGLEKNKSNDSGERDH
jgi:guanylate kinase